MAHTPSYDSTLEDLLHKVGPKVLRELENFEAPLKSALTKVQRQGEVVLKRIKAGENKSFGFMADGASTATGVTVGYDTYSLKGKIFFGKILIDRGAAVQARGNAKTTADIVMSEIESAGRTALRQLNHACFHGSGIVHTLTSGQSNAIGTVAGGTPEEIEGTNVGLEVRAGQALDVYASGGAYKTTVVVTKRDVEIGAGTVSFWIDTLDGTGNYVSAANDEFYIRGAKDNGMVGLKDVVAGAGTTLFGLTDANVANWAGNSRDLGGALTASAYRTLQAETLNRSGNGALKSSMYVMNTNRLMETYEIEESKIRFSDTKVAIGSHESMHSIGGIPVLVDESCPNDRVFLVNKEDVKLAVFKELYQDGDGTPGKDKGSMHFQISQSALTYEAEMWGMYNLEVEARNRSGQLYNIS